MYLGGAAATSTKNSFFFEERPIIFEQFTGSGFQQALTIFGIGKAGVGTDAPIRMATAMV